MKLPQRPMSEAMMLSAGLPLLRSFSSSLPLLQRFSLPTPTSIQFPLSAYSDNTLDQTCSPALPEHSPPCAHLFALAGSLDLLPSFPFNHNHNSLKLSRNRRSVKDSTPPRLSAKASTPSRPTRRPPSLNRVTMSPGQQFTSPIQRH